MITLTNASVSTSLTLAFNADANMGQGFAIVIAHIGNLRALLLRLTIVRSYATYDMTFRVYFLQNKHSCLRSNQH
jgi:hypothetical protein